MKNCMYCKNRLRLINGINPICEACVAWSHYVDAGECSARYYDTDITNELMRLKRAINALYGSGLCIKNVIFNDPATIVFWTDGGKTVVKCDGEDFDPEKGLAMAICKGVLGNKGNYYEVFKKWLPKEELNSEQDDSDETAE